MEQLEMLWIMFKLIVFVIMAISAVGLLIMSLIAAPYWVIFLLLLFIL